MFRLVDREQELVQQSIRLKEEAAVLQHSLTEANVANERLQEGHKVELERLEKGSAEMGLTLCSHTV